MTDSVAVIFVSTNEGHLLVPALDSLFATAPERGVELVVVDNASDDGLSRVVAERWPQARILVQRIRRSLAVNLNRAMTETSSPYAMWCDADMLFKPGAVDVLADFLDRGPRVGIVKPKLVSPDGALRAAARRWYTFGTLLALRGPWRARMAGRNSVRRNLYADWDYREARGVDWLPFAGAMVRREAYEAIGGVDERFPFYFEDVDFSLRLHEGGWEVWCLPFAEMVHFENRASAQVFSRAGWRHFVSFVKFWLKHKGLRPRRAG